MPNGAPSAEDVQVARRALERARRATEAQPELDLDPRRQAELWAAVEAQTTARKRAGRPLLWLAASCGAVAFLVKIGTSGLETSPLERSETLPPAPPMLVSSPPSTAAPRKAAGSPEAREARELRETAFPPMVTAQEMSGLNPVGAALEGASPTPLLSPSSGAEALGFRAGRRSISNPRRPQPIEAAEQQESPFVPFGPGAASGQASKSERGSTLPPSAPSETPPPSPAPVRPKAADTSSSGSAETPTAVPTVLETPSEPAELAETPPIPSTVSPKAIEASPRGSDMSATPPATLAAPSVDPGSAPRRVGGVAAMMRDADGARREGRLREAAEGYRRASRHTRAGPFLEEALFREAELRFQLGEVEVARARLSEATERVATPYLRRERSELGRRVDGYPSRLAP